ncbi:hypothetical protein WG66_003386 [Moniliophthora roreri]|nr:hypothetical protein WG66_003386 [Moniliophthora roreri]
MWYGRGSSEKTQVTAPDYFQHIGVAPGVGVADTVYVWGTWAALRLESSRQYTLSDKNQHLLEPVGIILGQGHHQTLSDALRRGWVLSDNVR